MISRIGQKVRIRKAAKSAFALVDFLCRPMRGPRILVYHQVGVALGREMEVSVETFRRHLEIIEEYGQVRELEAAIEDRAASNADRYVVLTFDDGYEDIYWNAFPALLDRGWPFTLYLTTRPVETGEPIDPRYPEARPLTWDQVREMLDTGLALIGAHTHTHPDLSRESVDRIRWELDESDRLIESATGTVPGHFTYPWGRRGPDADRLVRQRYVTATLGGGGALSPATDLHEIPRIPVQNSDGVWFFERKLRTGLQTEDRLRRYLRQ